MAYYSSLGPNNYCCYNESEVERTKTVEIQAPVDYVWSILTNVHDYSTWSDFSLTGVISQGASITLKDNSTMVQSDDGRLYRVKAIMGRVSKLIDSKLVEFSFNRGEVGWSVGLAFYLEELGSSLTRVSNATRYFGPHGEQVEKVLNQRMGHLKLFCENSRSRASSLVEHRRLEPSSPPIAVAILSESVNDPMQDVRPPNGASVDTANTISYRTPQKKAESIADEILKLADLKKQGLLSEDEYAAAKRRLLYDSNGYTRLYG